MMLSRFLPTTYLTAVLFLASCNGGGEKTSTEKTTSDTTANTTTTTTTTAAPSTIVTTPQNMLVIKHKVANFAKWIVAYESHDSTRLANGLHNYVIGRGKDDSNMVLVALRADDISKAKAFAKDPGLKKAMQKGGVTGTPIFNYITETFQDTATIGTNIRSLTMYKVKDWSVWEKVFLDGKQERIDNGLTDRVYGHDADDNKKIALVVAVVDSAKAAAYWKSDMLKKRRQDAGTIGVPDRFIYSVVKKY